MAQQTVSIQEDIIKSMPDNVSDDLAGLGNMVSESLEKGSILDIDALPKGKVDYRFLFEFPPMLLDKRAQKAAAILFKSESEVDVLFLVFRKKAISVVASPEAPGHLADFARSFANILSLIPFSEIELKDNADSKSLQ